MPSGIPVPTSSLLIQHHIHNHGTVAFSPQISKNPTWYVSLVACEVLLQLPFFFIASYAFIKRANWIRTPCIVYGAHVATTLVPILSDILFGPDSGPKRVTLFFINLPFAIIPLMLLVRMAVVSEPFPAASGGSRKKKGGKSKAQ